MAEDEDFANEKIANSKKTEVIEILFERFWPVGRGRPDGPMIVTFDELDSAIKERNARHSEEKRHLSTDNKANFLKDLIRPVSCNKNWPQRLKDLRITARQRYGQKQIMEFIDYEQKEDDKPFMDRYDPVEGMDVLHVESLTIPREARKLGRRDEAWLIQVVVSQRIVETHFAVIASALNVQSIAHLQMSVKTQPEIDFTFVATLKQNAQELRAYVTGEAKRFGQRILEHQIREQVSKAFEITANLSGVDVIEAVIPLALKVDDYPVNGAHQRGIYVAQFEAVKRSKFNADYVGENLCRMPLVVQSRAFYLPMPSIHGISR